MIRTAQLCDLDRLVGLEQRCFETDRLSRRNLRHMLTRANASTVVDEENGRLRGYGLVLFMRGTAQARLYSIAVDQGLRGAGVGRGLLAACEKEALDRGCVCIRSEVREDNTASLNMFLKAGYRQFRVVPDYYEDHMTALRLERTLVPQPDLTLIRVPYYRQTLDFTCGSAALMMAMKALDPSLTLDRRLELRIWQEATTVFMTSGHGGCGPHGLALSAHARGFEVEIFVKSQDVFLVRSVRDPSKREVMRLLEEDRLDQISRIGIPLEYRSVGFEELKLRLGAGSIPVVLISSARLGGSRSPHWVVITGCDDRFVWIHDPFVDEKEGRTDADATNLPIARADFERMARYGRGGQQAVLVVSAPGQSTLLARNQVSAASARS